MVLGVLLFNLYLPITIKYIYNYTATMDHGKYFQYYIQGDVPYLDHINISYLATCWRSLWVGLSSISKSDDFTFPTVIFPFISSNIPA